MLREKVTGLDFRGKNANTFSDTVGWLLLIFIGSIEIAIKNADLGGSVITFIRLVASVSAPL